MHAKVIYATITGNNEKLADLIIERLISHNVETIKEEISLSDPASLKDFDLIVLVPYTYDLGALPDEGLDFYEELASMDLSNLKYAVAGSGDDFYGNDFCKAVDIFDEALKNSHAQRATTSLKINLWPQEDDISAIDKFVDELLN